MDIAILFVVGEEVDHCGMTAANALKLTPQFLIVAEPTDSKLARMQKGILKLTVASKGVACHSGYPELGVDAIAPLLDVLTAIRDEKWPADAEIGATTVNIGVLKGGAAANVVPEAAEASVMFRLVSAPDPVFARVAELAAAKGRGQVTVTRTTSNPPVRLATMDGYPISTVCFNTDIPYFNMPADAKAFLYGPGSITDAHCEREFIKLSDLKQSVGDYFAMAERLLTRGH